MSTSSSCWRFIERTDESRPLRQCVHPRVSAGSSSTAIASDFTEKPQAGEGWINGGFFVFEPAIFDYLEDDRTVLESDALEQLAEDGQLMAYRHDGFWQCMDTLGTSVYSNRFGRVGTRPGKYGREHVLAGPPDARHRRDRSRGRLARASPARCRRKRRLSRARLGPGLGMLHSGVIEKVKVVRGDVCDSTVLERVLGEYEIDTVMHLAAQTIVPIANRNPFSTFETNIGGTWKLLEACRRSPQVRQIVVASSDKAYGDQIELPYIEDAPLRGQHPTTSASRALT